MNMHRLMPCAKRVSWQGLVQCNRHHRRAFYAHGVSKGDAADFTRGVPINWNQ